jgi:hypothetical protein
MVGSDHTSTEIPRKVKVHAIVSRISDAIHRKLEEVEKWRPNYARNANKPIPVEPAITTKKLNAPTRLASMRLLNRVTSHPKTREDDVRYNVGHSECSV